MSSYIVDTSVVIQRLIRDTQTEHARALFSGLVDDDGLIVPEFCLLECTNVLWKQVRFQGMTSTTADLLINDLTNLPLTVYSAAEFLRRGLKIGLAHQLAIYDSVYIALAESLGYPLITVDEHQSKAALAEGIPLKSLSDFKSLS
ncbi:MAG: twitching motility protein PilT [Anaerolineaceae bacterium]|nr:twitching motility protein PilT [Anaerolineaceae bacterium]